MDLYMNERWSHLRMGPRMAHRRCESIARGIRQHVNVLSVVEVELPELAEENSSVGENITESK